MHMCWARCLEKCCIKCSHNFSRNLRFKILTFQFIIGKLQQIYFHGLLNYIIESSRHRESHFLCSNNNWNNSPITNCLSNGIVGWIGWILLSIRSFFILLLPKPSSHPTLWATSAPAIRSEWTKQISVRGASKHSGYSNFPLQKIDPEFLLP